MPWVVLGLSAVLAVAALLAGIRSHRPERPAATGPDLSVHLERLHRLQERHAREPSVGGIGLAARHRACQLAYDQVLVECARALGIEAPALPLSRPLPPSEQLHLEVELVAYGLRW